MEEYFTNLIYPLFSLEVARGGEYLTDLGYLPSLSAGGQWRRCYPGAGGDLLPEQAHTTPSEEPPGGGPSEVSGVCA